MRTTRPFSRREFLGHAVAGAAGWGLARSVYPAGSVCPADANKLAAWQIGIYTRPWAACDYRTALDAIAEAGFKHLGLMTIKGKNGVVLSIDSTHGDAHAAADEAKKRGLRIVSVYAGGFPIEKQSLQRSVQGLKKLIDLTAAAEGQSLLLGGIGQPELQDPYYKTVAACCDYAADRRITIAIKPHGGQNATGPQCRKWIETVGHKSFRLWYDPGNIFYYSDGKLDPAEDAATVDGLVCGMSVKDYLPPKRVDVTPGTGRVDFPKVMERLKKGGFTSGPLVIETLSPGDPKALVEEARKARRFVERLVGA